MKIAVISDIHANYPALLRVAEDLEAWQPDAVIMAGDLVTRGPFPLECLRFIQEKESHAGWRVVRGNHEDYVIAQARPGAPRHGPAFEVNRPSYWVYQQMGLDVSYLEAMPFQQKLYDPGGREVHVFHASRLSNRDGIYPETNDGELARRLGLTNGTSPEVVCVGHTHRSLTRSYLGTLVVNAGSVGLPFDLDRRAAYARLTWQSGAWRAEIVRLAYDWQATDRAFVTQGYLEGAGPLAKLVQVELREAHSQLYQWAVRYQARARAGEISMEQSVDEFLALS